ncbi:MAG: T9SS type A sorting domain-containing protein [Flavobacteriales bacterium]
MAQIPQDLALNVRVRALVGGTITQYGPACRLELLGNGPVLLQQQTIVSDGNSDLQLWPNPNNGEVVNISLSVSDMEDGSATITLYDATGRIAFNRTETMADGLLNVTLDLGRTADGVYMMQVTVGGEIYNRRMVVSK